MKLPLGRLALALVKCGANGFKSDAVVGELHGIELDADRRLGAASDEYLTDALNLRDLLREDRVGHVVDLRLGDDVGGEREDENRGIGRVGFAVARVLRHIRRQLAAGGVDGSLHVAGCGIDVAIEIELEGDVGRAERTGRRHLVDAGDAAELTLERRGNGGGHGFGAGARHSGSDTDDGEINIGQRGDGQNRIRDGSREQSAMLSSEVATGRLMNGAERCIVACLSQPLAICRSEVVRSRRLHALRQPVEVEVDHGSGEEREQSARRSVRRRC